MQTQPKDQTTINKKKKRICHLADFAIPAVHKKKKKRKRSIDKHIHLAEILFCFVLFYGISTIVGYLMPNPFYTYILNIYDLVWLGFMTYQPL